MPEPILSDRWPVLTTYEGEYLTRVAMPLGGIGTGTISLGGRGDLRDWEIRNHPAKGFIPRDAFFALWARAAHARPVTRCLEGALQPPYEGPFGASQTNHGLPRFRRCSFHAAYPFAQVLLRDPDVPLAVRLEAFNPLVPADADASGLPVAVLRFVLINETDEHVEAAVCGSLSNFLGARGNTNRFLSDEELKGMLLESDGPAPRSRGAGTLALATTAGAEVTHRTAWADLSWGDSLLDFWDDFSADGRLEPREAGSVSQPRVSLAARAEVPAGEQRVLTFLLGWHFPNRYTWQPSTEVEGEAPPEEEILTNYYATRWEGAWEVLRNAAPRLPELEEKSLAFVRAFCGSDLPRAVKEAALFNLSTLRSPTCFRTADGRFYGWEGCRNEGGCCPGSCTHVWNYEQATAFLFGDLACTMRDVEFAHATDENGLMCFRVNLPLDHAQEWRRAAADGQMGCLMKLYRDWQLSGDDEMLRRLWPKARKALEFCWMPGGWDADRDGVMEGCQHNTMDVEYYGPNPQMGGWYLGALRAGEQMARHLGEEQFADTCRDLFERGSRWLDENLFNGEYYEHLIRPPEDPDAVADGLRQGMGASNPAEPVLQLGRGCLVDQLVGQYMAHVCGLGYLLDPANVRGALRSVMSYNFQENLYGHFNHNRTFALNDESALLMATYPRGDRPKRPFPYFKEVMTGFEYTAAVHMLYEGQVDAGLRCILAVRDRYDGRRRNPFDEAECGHHYARAMASWAAVPALTGFRYSAVTKTMRFAAAREPARWFWSNGYAWGTFRQEPTQDGTSFELRVLHGELKLGRLVLEGIGQYEAVRATLGAGASLQGSIDRET